MSGALDRDEVALGEDDHRIESTTGRPSVSFPDRNFEPAGEPLWPRGHLKQGPQGRRIVVDEDRRDVSPRRSVDVLRHRLQVNFDYIRAPCIEEALQQI